MYHRIAGDVRVLALAAMCCFTANVRAEQISATPNQTEPAEPHWHLFLDNHVIARSTGFQRILRHPQPRGVALKPDQPWESMGVEPKYVGRRKDGTLECYYGALWWDIKPGEKLPPGYDHPRYRSQTAYAISQDGIHWQKHKLNMLEGPAGPIDRETWFPYPVPTGNGTANNLVSCGVPRDLWLYGNVRDPDKHFAIQVDHRVGGRIAFCHETPDLLNDPDWQKKLMLPGGYVHTRHNTLEFWDEMHQEWVVTRQAPNHAPTRCAGRYASPDLKNWTLDHFLYPDAEDSTDPRYFDEVYGISTIYIEGMALGLLHWFTGDDTHSSTEDLGLIGTNTGKGTMEIRLVTSRDGGMTWDRTVSRKAWIPCGTEQDSYDRLVRPGAPPLRMGDEDWFYCITYNGDHLAARRYYRDRIEVMQGALYVQKHNRYVSLTAGNRPRILITKPLEVTGKTLQLNVDGNRGEVKVAIGIDKWIEHERGSWPFNTKLPHWMVEDRWGNKHLEKGFGFDDCEPVHVDSIEHNVRWKEASLEQFLGQTVRLYILVQDADLYGLRFK